MSHGGGSGPPDKWVAFSTAGMSVPTEFARKLSELYALGYTGQVVAIPSPSTSAIADVSWVAVAGYDES